MLKLFSSLLIYLAILNALTSGSVITLSESSNSIDSVGLSANSSANSFGLSRPPDSAEPPDPTKNRSKANKVILILADGIRYDYLNDLTEFQGFRRMANNGVKSLVTPIFPSNSYPNWYTILTGLYAGNYH